MLLNTSRSIFKKPDVPVEPVAAGANPSAGEALAGSNANLGAVNMPDQEQRPQEDGPDDESSEGDPDREGNTDPGTNAPPEPADDGQGDLQLTPAEIRQQAILDAHAQVQSHALNQAAADLPAEEVLTAPIRLQQFKYLSIGHDKGMFHVTGTKPNGEVFSETVDAGPNLTLQQIVAQLEVIYSKFS